MKKIFVPLIITAFSIILIFVMFENIETFFGDLLNQAKDNQFKYALVSFAALVSDIVLPVPSSIVMYSNGAVLGLIKGFSLSLISVILSSIIGYFIGFGSSAILKSKSDISANKILEKYGYAAILMTRGIPIISESVCIVCGFNKYNFTLYMLFTIIGYIPVCLIYAYFGSIAVNRDLFLISFICSLFVTFLLWFLGRKKIESSEQNKYCE